MTPTSLQLGQELAQTLTYISNAKNAAAITNWQKDGGPFPQIETVNTALVIQLETSGTVDDPRWLSIYSYSTYVPPPPPITVPLVPNKVVGPFSPNFPGFFELSPDGPSIPVGSQVNVGGVTYTKEIVAANPFSPNGGTTAWKE